jgi:PPOX class probable F420-dependent enzyme
MSKDRFGAARRSIASPLARGGGLAPAAIVAGMATPMTPHERRAFLLHGTRTAVLSTIRADGRPHAAPVWFTLDGDDVIFNTNAATVKGKNLARDPRATITVDEGAPPFSFVTMDGTVTLADNPPESLRWASEIGARYMGADVGEQFGRRNAVPGEYLVRFTPTRITAFADIAGD